MENRDYLIQSDKSSLDGRLPDSVQLTCDAFKVFCLLAEAESLLEEGLDFLPSKVNSTGGGFGRKQKGQAVFISNHENSWWRTF